MILVPENITSICTGVQTRTETGVWRIRCPNSPLGKLVPCLSWAGEHTGMGCRALGCESQVIPLQCWGSGLPEAHCHARMWLSARAVCGWEKAGRTGTFLLSAPDRFWPTAPRFVGTQGGPCLFLPAQLTSPNMEKEVDLWPGDAQDKGAIRPAGLQGKQREDQEWEIKGTESPPGSGSNQNENCSVMFDILYFFPSASTAHTVLPQITTRPLRSVVNIISERLALLDYSQSYDIYFWQTALTEIIISFGNLQSEATAGVRAVYIPCLE